MFWLSHKNKPYRTLGLLATICNYPNSYLIWRYNLDILTHLGLSQHGKSYRPNRRVNKFVSIQITGCILNISAKKAAPICCGRPFLELIFGMLRLIAAITGFANRGVCTGYSLLDTVIGWHECDRNSRNLRKRYIDSYRA